VNSRSIREVVNGLKTEAERAAVAQQDPAIRDSIASQYDGKLVAAPTDLLRRTRERDWAGRGIPERIWPMLHDGAPDQPVGPRAPQPWEALEVVGRFTSPAEPKTILVLAGKVDTGKTVAAAWGAAWGLGRFVKAIDLVRAGLYPADPFYWPRLHGERLLVMDDLGAEPLDPKGFGLAAISSLIDQRYDGARKTIITTNYSLEAFRDRYGTGAGERIWRRLVEVGKFHELRGRGVDASGGGR
jgi:hypothetical protein